MDINFLKNPNFSNYSSPIYDGEEDIVLNKPAHNIEENPVAQTDLDLSIIRLLMSCFFGLIAVALAFSILNGRSVADIQKLIFVILIIFWGPVGFVAGQYFKK